MNTSKNAVGKTVLIVLIVLVSVFDLFWLMGIIGIGIEQNETSGIDLEYLSYARPHGAPYLEKLGKQYEENAQAGYTFYRVHVPVVSAGTTELSPEYDLYMNAEGQEYSDVQSYYHSGDEQENMFTYTNIEILPPGQKGELTEVILVRDGVEQISVTVYATSDDYYNEKNGQETWVEIP